MALTGLSLLCGVLAAVIFEGIDASVMLLLLCSVLMQAVLLSLGLVELVAFGLFRFEQSTNARAGKPLLSDNALAVLAALTVFWAGLSPVVGLLWLLAVAALRAKEFHNLGRRLLKRRPLVEQLKRGYVTNPPQVVVHLSGMTGSAYQINQWLPVLERLDCPVAIIVRKRHLLQGISSTSLPIYFARSHDALEWLLANGPRAVLYPGNPMENAQALRQYQLNHFFINHGESDKAVNQSKMLLAYDKLLVGGPLAERRLREAGLKLRDDQVEHVGRPQAELQLIKQHRAAERVRRVLYAPTWEGFGDNVNYSSIGPLGMATLRTLIASGEYEVIFKPHPYTGSKRRQMRAALNAMLDLCRQAGVTVLTAADSLHEAMNWSDLLVTDISSVLNEYLVTGKPIVLCCPAGHMPADLVHSFPSAKAAYVIEEGEQILQVMADIEGGDPKQEARREVRYDSLGDGDSSAMDRFAAVIYRSLAT